MSRKFFEKLGMFLLLLGVSIVCLGIFQGQYGVKKYVELQKSHEILNERVEKLVSHKKYLETEIIRIKNSKEYATKVIKEKYRIREPGEFLETYE